MGAPRVEVVKNPETASEQLVAAAAQQVTIADSAGRKITLRKPPVLQQYRFVEVMGDTAKNEVYMAMAFPLLFITSIDGLDQPAPMKKSEFEALIARLDEHGIKAVTEGVQQHFAVKFDPEAQKDAVKK